MKKETLTLENALSLGNGSDFPFVYARGLEFLYLGKNPMTSPVKAVDDLEKMLEIRYFQEKKELRLFQREGEWCAVSLTLEESDQLLPVIHGIQNKKYGNSLRVTKVLAYDDHGQAYISHTLLSDWGA